MEKPEGKFKQLLLMSAIMDVVIYNIESHV